MLRHTPIRCLLLDLPAPSPVTFSSLSSFFSPLRLFCVSGDALLPPLCNYLLLILRGVEGCGVGGGGASEELGPPSLPFLLPSPFPRPPPSLKTPSAVLFPSATKPVLTAERRAAGRVQSPPPPHVKPSSPLSFELDAPPSPESPDGSET